MCKLAACHCYEALTCRSGDYNAAAKYSRAWPHTAEASNNTFSRLIRCLEQYFRPFRDPYLEKKQKKTDVAEVLHDHHAFLKMGLTDPAKIKACIWQPVEKSSSETTPQRRQNKKCLLLGQSWLTLSHTVASVSCVLTHSNRKLIKLKAPHKAIHTSWLYVGCGM